MNVFKDTLNLYPSLSFKEKARIFGRLFLGRYAQIIDKTPKIEGPVLDFGCGHGVYLNLLRHYHKIDSGLGIDIDLSKIQIAQKAALPGVSFRQQSLEKCSNTFKGIVSSDVFYLIPFQKWPPLFELFWKKLDNRGHLVVKTVLKKNNWKHWLGTFQEFLSIHVLRITSRRDSGFVFLNTQEWKSFLSDRKFDIVEFHEFKWTPYNHALILCRKRN